MSSVKNVGRKEIKIKFADNILTFWCPACDMRHRVVTPKWTWNNSTDLPTISPSILVKGVLYGPDQLPFHKYNGPAECESTPYICHSYVENGTIRYLGDSTHSMKLLTMYLPDLK